MSAAGDEVYSTIMSGKLALKGGLKLTKEKKAKKSKKKKSKKSKKKKSYREEEKGSEEADGSAIGGDSRNRKRSRSVSSEEEDSGLTAAQKRFLQVQEKREKDLIARMASKTHRERINEFNEKLAALSEHHDVPKVGNAGMG